MNSIHTSPGAPTDQTPAPSTYYLHARPEVVALVPLTAQRILDVGCGAGGLSAALKTRQPAEIHGIEIVQGAAEHARLHLDHVWNSAIEEALPHLPDSHYDCIVIADVLEHLLDPLFVLAELKKKLKSTGRLVASIPNIQNWDVLAELLQGKWDYSSDGILDRTHLRFFTRKSVQEVFWSAGFRIVSLSTTHRGEMPPHALLDTMENLGLSAKELETDGGTFQFLIEAEVPDLSAKPKVVIVILNWNGKSDTLECLDSIQKIDYPNYQTVVVDNGSTDGSVDAIKSQFPDTVILETGANLGYAGGNNVGIKWALEKDAEYVLLLNNDTIANATLISAFIEAAAQAPQAILGAKIFYYDRPDVLWFAGGKWKNSSMLFEHVGHGKTDSEEFAHFRQYDYVTGCALFASASAFKQVGLLDEKFFLTYEETDWCYRARNIGFQCVVTPRAKLWHKVSSSFGGATSPLATYFMFRNKLLWARKHCSGTKQRLLKRKAWHQARLILLPPFAIPRFEHHFARNIVWAVASWVKAVRRNLANPVNKATLYGLRDFYLGKFGNCPPKVRALRQSKKMP